MVVERAIIYLRCASTTGNDDFPVGDQFFLLQKTQREIHIIVSGHEKLTEQIRNTQKQDINLSGRIKPTKKLLHAQKNIYLLCRDVKRTTKIN